MGLTEKDLLWIKHRIHSGEAIIIAETAAIAGLAMIALGMVAESFSLIGFGIIMEGMSMIFFGFATGQQEQANQIYPYKRRIIHEERILLNNPHAVKPSLDTWYVPRKPLPKNEWGSFPLKRQRRR